MPVLSTRPVSAFPIGNIPLSQHHAMLPRGWNVAADAWVDASELAELPDEAVLVDSDGDGLAWRGQEPGGRPRVMAVHSFRIRHSWELLRANENYLGGLVESKIEGEMHALAAVEGVVRIGEGTRVLPGVFIEGNVVIGRNCRIGPNCHIRGHTSIGDGCRVGNAVEIKNSILLAGACVGHLSYVGDSILGERVNFGAGTVTSNFRHDGKNHRTTLDGRLVDTGRWKLGAIVGDDVKTGVHTAIYPGRKLYAGITTRPGEVVRKDVGP